MEEIWKDVVGYEGYYKVSNFGNIDKLPTTVHNPKGDYVQNGKRMSPFNNGKGYLVISFKVKGVKKNSYVHRLVADAFIPNPLRKKTVNHKDGDKSNNCVSNLEWATYSENLIHATSVLGVRVNEKAHNCIIKKDEVIKIFETYATGMYSHYDIATMFGIDHNHVYRIMKRIRRFYVDVPDDLLFKVRVVHAIKKGLTYYKNKTWFDSFDKRLKEECYELWDALHNKKKKHMDIAKRNGII